MQAMKGINRLAALLAICHAAQCAEFTITQSTPISLPRLVSRTGVPLMSPTVGVSEGGAGILAWNQAGPNGEYNIFVSRVDSWDGAPTDNPRRLASSDEDRADRAVYLAHHDVECAGNGWRL